ncbi:enolase C-terminal domain-like protein [Streptomyces caniferus]|uniref:enolase C-terminal domain-like protein n=1 Tax=Streptomyces caniferus TaxID=285557 RepID=UPI0039A62467
MCGAPARWASAPPGRVPPGWPPGGRVLEEFRLVWIEEPLDAYDAEGHAALVASLDTPVATGEMLSGAEEHSAEAHTRLIEAGAADVVQPDAPRDRACRRVTGRESGPWTGARCRPAEAGSPRWAGGVTPGPRPEPGRGRGGAGGREQGRTGCRPAAHAVARSRRGAA